MAGHSVPIDFVVDTSLVQNVDEREKILSELILLIEPFSGKLSKINICELNGGNFLYIYASNDMTVSIKVYSNGLISSTVEYFTDTVNVHKIENDDGLRLEKEIKKKFACKTVKVLPAIKRAPLANPYFTTTDLGESDLLYTCGLMNKGNENYEGKEILILGGGDGALLYELLKENPKFVTMIDIDEVVMKASRKYLRSVCGNCLDNYDGENYKIIVGDAIQYMKNYLSEGRIFDYVFGDLTDIPISPSPRGQLWDFIHEIINLGTKLLKPSSGKYMTHATSNKCEKALKIFEDKFASLDVPVSVTSTSNYVPSFLETWVFFQATRIS